MFVCFVRSLGCLHLCTLGCQDGTIRGHGDSCYVFSDPAQTKSQDDAQISCSIVYQGHLLYIETYEELSVISGLIPDTEEYWIGLMSEYVWLDGTPATYQDFQPSNASHNNGDLCFRLRPHNNFLWNSFKCDIRYAYICERNITRDTKRNTRGNWKNMFNFSMTSVNIRCFVSMSNISFLNFISAFLFRTNRICIYLITKCSF